MRDKLMGRESLDIDIALDNMLGKEFADTVNQYLESHVCCDASPCGLSICGDSTAAM